MGALLLFAERFANAVEGVRVVALPQRVETGAPVNLVELRVLFAQILCEGVPTLTANSSLARFRMLA